MAADETPPEQPESSDSDKVVRLPDLRAARERGKRMPPVDETEAARLAKVRMRLGPGCPYVPLGYDGKHYWALDCDHHLIGKTDRELSRNQMISLCGDATWLTQRYPRTRQGKPVNGFASETATEDLMACCHDMGTWAPADSERGLGAWLGADGDLVLHRGSHLIVKGVVRPLGRYGTHVYTQRPAQPKLPPAKERAVARAGEDLLERLDTFPWARGTFDSMLLLGQTGCAMLGGALPFRPHMWITADFGVGKSTLHLLLNHIFGLTNLLHMTDTSPAGIRHTLRSGSVPISYDEFEAEADSTGQDRIVKLIRDASSGSNTLRGSSSGEGVAFPLVSCFFCQSVIIPPMSAQDRSRFIILEMIQQAEGDPRIFSTDRLAEIGTALTRRMIERFDVMMSEVLPAYRLAIMRRGALRRTADIYATVFAAAAVALYDDWHDFKFEEKWLTNRHMEALLAEAATEQTPEWRRAVDYLLGTPVEKNRPDGTSWGDLIERAAWPLLNPHASGLFDKLEDAERAQNRLMSVGLRVVGKLAGKPLEEPHLVIATTHRGLLDIFAGTHWRTLAHAAGGGGWAQVLRRAKGATRTGVMRFKMIRSTGTALPLSLVLAPSDGPLAADVQQPDATNGEARPAVH
jgi:hypothetical protein